MPVWCFLTIVFIFYTEPHAIVFILHAGSPLFFYKEFPGVVARKFIIFRQAPLNRITEFRITALVWCNSVLLFHGIYRLNKKTSQDHKFDYYEARQEYECQLMDDIVALRATVNHERPGYVP
ncbi:hypothetical protein [Mangrovibacter yixingensis]|uniref:hypothetical protein n=1 Tax=Mangrovibacter yixingensis TaxID=1529639 RepID=UPI001CFCC77F|nr:hypothetical protein [Mangrovibacter yixingensis]